MDHTKESKRERLTINVGSRNSQLALIQTNSVIRKVLDFYENNPDKLRELNDGRECYLHFNIISMTTSGDQILDKALSDIGSKSLFTKELEIALIEQKVDFVVHSLKDLPTTLPDGCAIGAILERDDPNDTIVLKKSLRDHIKPLDLILTCGQGADRDAERCKIGTSSQRRIAMLRRHNDTLECVNIRGNLNTRIAKLDRDDGEYSAIILAKAGLDRMGWSDRGRVTLSPSFDPRLHEWCYAVGQGAIAVECRNDDDRILNLLAPIVHLRTTFEAVTERCLMRKLEGGCSVPLGVRSSWIDSGLYQELSLCAIVLSIDGKNVVQADGRARLSAVEESLHKTKPIIPDMSETTGIVLSSKLLTSTVVADLDECSKLGIGVANKMIDLGCLELMRPKS